MTQILVIGAGLIGRRHVQTVQSHGRAVLAGIVDPFPPANLPAGVPLFADISDVDLPRVQGAIIASPTGLHHSHALACAKRGWHMIIEKPIASTLDEATEIAQATTNVHTLMGHHRRHHGVVQALKRIIDDGTIGRPIAVNVLWGMKKPDSYFETLWRVTGADPVQMNMIHDLDLLLYLFGPVTHNQILAANPVRGAARPESGTIGVQFAGGVIGSLTFADTTPTPWGFEAATGENPNIATTGQDMMWVMGTKGGVSFPSLTVWGGSDTWAKAPHATKITVDKTNALTAQLDHFLDVIDGKVPSLNPAAQGAAMLRLITDLRGKLGDHGSYP